MMAHTMGYEPQFWRKSQSGGDRNPWLSGCMPSVINTEQDEETWNLIAYIQALYITAKVITWYHQF